MSASFSTLVCVLASWTLLLSACKQDGTPKPKAKDAPPTLRSSPQQRVQTSGKPDTTPTTSTAKAKDVRPQSPKPTEAPKAAPNVAPGSPKPTVAQCTKACANVLKVSLADAGGEAPEFKQTLKKTVERDCPRQCAKHGTVASVECLMNAKTASEMTACPR